MTRSTLALLHPLHTTESTMLAAPAERRQPAVPAALERLITRLACEVESCPEEGDLPAVEVRALLQLLETQARHLQALAQGVGT